MRTYNVHSMSYHIQQEGAKVGIPMLFVEFACNSLIPTSENDLTIAIATTFPSWVCFVGRDPAVHLTSNLVNAAHAARKRVMVETLGTFWNSSFDSVDYLAITPSRHHTLAPEFIARREVDEIRILATRDGPVMHPRQLKIKARHVCISPVVHKNGTVDPQTLHKAIKFVKRHPFCRLSVRGNYGT